MSDSYGLSPRRKTSPKTQKKRSSTSMNSRGRFMCKSDLKSTIPKPTPYVRNKDSLRTRSSSSCQSQPIHPSRIPLPVWAVDRGKTSASFQHYASTNPLPRKQASGGLSELRTHTRSQSPAKKNKSDFLRPKSASVFRNPYPNVKAKIDTKSPLVPKIKIPLNVRLVATPDSNRTAVSRGESVDNEQTEQTIGEESRLTNDEFLEKQRQLLKLYNELRKVQPPKELQPLEMEVSKLIQSQTLGHPEGHLRNTLLLSEGSPEFLSTFENQMQEVTEMWLRLICDLVLTKLAAGNASLSRLSLPDPSLDLREEVLKFLSSLPTEGEALHIKLQRIEKEQLKVMTVVVHSVLALFKQHEELKDSHFRLEKTQDQIHFELKEQIAILGEENEELDRKYQRSVEKYNVERTKTEQQEKYKMTLNREIIDMKKLMKCLDGKFHEWDAKTRKIETVCRNLDVSVKNKGVSFEKESKGHRETIHKLKEANATIEKLKKELTEQNEMLSSIEKTNKELKDELLTKQASLDELEQKRKETLDELSIKNMRLLETEERLNAIQAYMSNSNPGIKDMYDISSKLPIESLLKDNHQKDLHIQELKKEVNRFEHVLKEKSTREEMLMMQLAELQKQPYENEVTLRTQIKELQYELKDTNKEKAELERIIAQKTLELDQRDLLMREHSQILRARDELIPLVQSKQRREKEYVEKLSAIIIEQQKTYFNQGDEVYANSGEPNVHEMMKALEKRYTLDPKLVDKELTFRQEKMTELFNLLEHKQMEMMRLERRIGELQGVREEKEMLEKEKEARIFNLQKELEDRKSGKSRGKKFFILLLRNRKQLRKKRTKL